MQSCPRSPGLYDPLQAGSIDGTDLEPHDRAVRRALRSRYRPNRAVVGDPLLTLFVSRLSPQTSEQRLQEVFSRFGDIQRLRLVRDAVTGFSRRFAFIEYRDQRALARAHRDGHRLLLDQAELLVDRELQRTLPGWRPRRLGGGFGGRKESGQLRFGGRDRPFRKPIHLGTGPGTTGGNTGKDWGAGPGPGGDRRDRLDQKDRREDWDRRDREDRDRDRRDRGDRDRGDREDRDRDRGDREDRDRRDRGDRDRGDREDRDRDRGDRGDRDRKDREDRDRRDREDRDRDRGDRGDRDRDRGDRGDRDRGDRGDRDRDQGDRGDRDRSRHRDRR